MEKTRKIFLYNISILLLLLGSILLSLLWIPSASAQETVNGQESESAVLDREIQALDVYADLSADLGDYEKVRYARECDETTTRLTSARVYALNTETETGDSALTQEIVYDLADRPTFLLVIYQNGGYAIFNRLTGNSMERTKAGESPYGQSTLKKYYGGFGNYFVKENSRIKEVRSGKVIDQGEQAAYAENSDQVVRADVKEAESEISLFTTNTEREKYTTIMADGDYFENLMYTQSGNFLDTDSFYRYDDVYGYDMLFPDNDGSSCGIVATVQMLQFYARAKGLHVIPDSFIDDQNYHKMDRLSFSESSSTKIGTQLANLTSKPYLSNLLHNKLRALTGKGAFGETYTQGLIDGLNAFFSKYQPESEEYGMNFTFTYHTGYDNMVANIQNGRPAVGMTTIGNGYYKEGSEWKKIGVERHHMVAYGYCTNGNGSLRDFVCHSGAYQRYTQKIYVYKLNFASNYTNSYSYHQ